MSGCKSPDHRGFNNTQSDFVVSRLVFFMQPQTSCNLILLASLCCNLRLGAIYTVTSSFDIVRIHGAGGGRSDRILSLCVPVTFSFSIRRFWGKGRRDCEKERERRDRKYITVSLFPPPFSNLKSQISPSTQGRPGYPGYVTLYIGILNPRGTQQTKVLYVEAKVIYQYHF